MSAPRRESALDTLTHALLGDLLRIQQFTEMLCCQSVRRELRAHDSCTRRIYREHARLYARRAALIDELFRDLEHRIPQTE